MLQLREGNPEPVTVKLAGDAWAKVRPAMAFERDLAVGRTGKLLAGLIQSADAASLAADLLGAEFVTADFTEPGWLDAAAHRIVLIDLATTCVTEWGGIVDQSGTPIEKPTRATLALLLRSAPTAHAIEDAMQREVNAEIAEKNGLAASPNGEAAADEPTAPIAEAPIPNAAEAS